MNLINEYSIEKSPYPVIIYENFLDIEKCNHIVSILNNKNNFDQNVMGGRKIIDVGTDNFKILLNEKFFLELFNFFNSKKIFNLFLEKLIKKSKFDKTLLNSFDNFIYSKKYNFSEILKIFNYFSHTIYLDFNFSLSQKGYKREIHRDKDNRIINFLLYFNEIKSKKGGDFEIYDQTDANASLSRHPDKNLLDHFLEITPKPGKLIVFLSSPNSYHAVSEMMDEKDKRFFVYGSYSTNKKQFPWQKFKL